MRHVSIAVGILLMTTGAATGAATTVRAPALDHVGIQASDLERSVAFYTGILGLTEVPAPFPRTEARWLAFGNSQLLHIVAHGRAGSEHNRWDHFALACRDLPAMIARLDALHWPWTDMNGGHEVQRRPDGIRQIFIRDPDGYAIELNDAGTS